MYHFIVISPITITLIVLLSIISYFIFWERNRSSNNSDNNRKAVENLPTAPGPRSYPIIGSMHLLGKYEIPYQAFGELAKTYGPIIKLDLGNVPSVVVNGQENIREVLINKGAHFDSRPNFRRYHQLFSGDKENSLAFCNWSNVQKSRREMLRAHTFPSSFSSRYQQLDSIIQDEIPAMIAQFDQRKIVDLKPIILNTCGNIFMYYFCSKRFNVSDKGFRKMISNYDEVFYEVNQGYAADFLPFLLPLHSSNLAKMSKWSHEIRTFIVSKVIGNRFENFDTTETVNDYIDSLIQHVKMNEKPEMEWNTALFALEDIIGGHSAIGNMLIKILSFIVTNPDVQRKMQEEIDSCLMAKNGENNNNEIETTQEHFNDIDIFKMEHEDDEEENENCMETTEQLHSTEFDCNDEEFENRYNEMKSTIDQSNEKISIKDRNSMPYTEAVILEGLRLIASPIVPHVSNQDSSIAGYKVPKDTLVFLNNYELNMSEKLWDKPEEFKPERFIKNGHIHKPDFFLPFGGGKRSCMGYKMVQLVGFSVLANLLNTFTLKPVSNYNYKVPIGNLALPANRQYNFGVERRK